MGKDRYRTPTYARARAICDDHRPNNSIFSHSNMQATATHRFARASLVIKRLRVATTGLVLGQKREPLSQPGLQLSRRTPARGIATSFAEGSSILHSHVGGAHELLCDLHASTGLPWVLSIPLAALIVRTVIALPLSVYARWQNDKKLSINPMILAWTRLCQRRIIETIKDRGVHVSPQEAQKRVLELQKVHKREVYKSYGVRRFSSLVPLLQMPAWLSMMEALRRMVGIDGGVLQWLNTLSDPLAGQFPVAVETSLANEGALWFPDLLSADPYHCLPLLLSGIMFTNITRGWKVPSKEELASKTLGQRRRSRAIIGLKRALQLVSLSIGPVAIAQGFPSGMIIYWLSSTTFATLQTQLLNRYWAPPKVPTPCKDYGVGSIKPITYTKLYHVFETVENPSPKKTAPSIPTVLPRQTPALRRYEESHRP